MRQVVVTGLGAVSPFGVGVKAFWSGLTSGTCAIRPLTLVAADGFRCQIGAEVPDAVPFSRRRSRADRLALAAAREAVVEAGLDRRERAEAALVIGAVGGGMRETEAGRWAVLRGGGTGNVLRAMLPYAHAATVGRQLGLGGPRETVVTACSSGAVAIVLAADLIADGIVECAVAGGVDAFTSVCFMGFNALKLLDPQPCRPFDRDRRGMSIGEGAAFVVLESADLARARGARVWATLAGRAMTTDAYHVTAPEPGGEGMVRAMRGALAEANVMPREVGYVNAHGTGTLQNDRIEALALRQVFGEGGVLVSSTKSMIGHTMAAAGSLEAVATVLTLANEVIPPTATLVTPDPDVQFDCVPGVAREASCSLALTNSFGFGGQNVSLLLRRG